HAREMRVVAQYGGDVSVARDHYGGPEQIENSRRTRHQRLVMRIGIGAERGIPGVEVNAFGGLVHDESTSSIDFILTGPPGEAVPRKTEQSRCHRGVYAGTRLLFPLPASMRLHAVQRLHFSAMSSRLSPRRKYEPL